MDRRRVGELAANGIDWEAIAGLAAAHCVSSLVYPTICALPPGLIPAPVVARLRERFRTTAARNLVMAGELLAVLERLRAAGVTAVPFKGPTLAVAAYGDLALREFADLDVLVPPTDAVRALRLLETAGYRVYAEFGAAPATASLASDWAHHFVLERSVAGVPVCVELHWAVDEPIYAFDVGLHTFGGRLATTTLCGARVPAIPPDDLLVVLCEHGTKHGWRRLQWVADVAEAVRRVPVRWDAAFRTAQAAGARRMLVLGLLLADRLLGAPLPDAVRAEVGADRVAAALADAVAAQTASPRSLEGRDWNFYLAARERLRDRVTCCRRLVWIPPEVGLAVLPRFARAWVRLMNALTPNERDRAAVRLPPRLGFLYYVVRPVRLLAKYGRRPLTWCARKCRPARRAV